MSEDKKDKGTDVRGDPRYRPSDAPLPEHDPTQKDRESSTGQKWLRGCGIALGIAALIFLFIVGACFIALSRW